MKSVDWARRKSVDWVPRAKRPWLVVVVAAGWSLWSVRATLLTVPYLDDASIHEQMVRFATQSLQSGRNPLTAWFPYLGEGSPQFLHYQSLGAMVTGLAGIVIGANNAFRWSLFLLVGLWPVCIYVSARVARLSPWVAAAAAAASPFIVSLSGVGYERGAYLWVGFGLWAQLWASWTLPLAWAFTWRSQDDRRFLFPAALLVALTVGLHYETGYLAILAVIAFPFMERSKLFSRLGRAAGLLVISLLASAWTWVPLITYGKWAAINQVLRNTPLENGYGARRILSWLFTGQIYDAGRFPVITILVLVGVVVALKQWRVNPLGRGLVIIWTLCLLLSFGRTTFGVLVDVIPGASDVFFRRFLMGTQLSGLLLAGVGAVAAAKSVVPAAHRISNRLYDNDHDRLIGRRVLFSAAAALAAFGVGSAVLQVGRYDARNAVAIGVQRAEDRQADPQIAPLIAYIKLHGGGRTYAGLPNNWGSSFTVGMVPIFKYLESKDIDEVGYTLRTASLMTDPEYYFDENNPSDYVLFGIRYLILPQGLSPPVPASVILRSGPYWLWTIKSNGYLDVVETVGVVSENRADIASQSLTLLRTDLIAKHEDLRVDYGGRARALTSDATPTDSHSSVSPGYVISGPNNLDGGVARGTVNLSRPAVVVLSASYDPGWTVRVDGRTRRTEMLAPAVVGVSVSAGVHRIVFVYRGFADYPELAALGVAALLAILLVSIGMLESVARLTYRRKRLGPSSDTGRPGDIDQ
jgi:hypothetical protein